MMFSKLLFCVVLILGAASLCAQETGHDLERENQILREKLQELGIDPNQILLEEKEIDFCSLLIEAGYSCADTGVFKYVVKTNDNVEGILRKYLKLKLSVTLFNGDSIDREIHHGIYWWILQANNIGPNTIINPGDSLFITTMSKDEYKKLRTYYEDGSIRVDRGRRIEFIGGMTIPFEIEIIIITARSGDSIERIVNDLDISLEEFKEENSYIYTFTNGIVHPGMRFMNRMVVGPLMINGQMAGTPMVF